MSELVSSPPSWPVDKRASLSVSDALDLLCLESKYQTPIGFAMAALMFSIHCEKETLNTAAVSTSSAYISSPF